jgi:curved DNA-binding protein CbpA
MSQSYSVLSDPAQRRSYDLSRTGSSIPPHRRRPNHHPGYTSASPGMGYAPGSSSGGRRDGAWTDNDERRSRANYAWQHPGRGKSAGEQASKTAHARADPFASMRSRAAPSTTDHFATYAGRARARGAAAQKQQQQQSGYAGPHTGSHYQAGTSVFGAAKAAEESRLINDSSTIRSGQVRPSRADGRFPSAHSLRVEASESVADFSSDGIAQVAFVFLAVFLIAYSLRHEEQDKVSSSRARR